MWFLCVAALTVGAVVSGLKACLRRHAVVNVCGVESGHFALGCSWGLEHTVSSGIMSVLWFHWALCLIDLMLFIASLLKCIMLRLLGRSLCFCHMQVRTHMCV